MSGLQRWRCVGRFLVSHSGSAIVLMASYSDCLEKVPLD